MTPEEIRAALDTLGLSQTDAAMMLGYGSQTRISEILAGKIQPNRSVILLLKAYIAGYRPEDWPQK